MDLIQLTRQCHVVSVARFGRITGSQRKGCRLPLLARPAGCFSGAMSSIGLKQATMSETDTNPAAFDLYSGSAAKPGAFAELAGMVVYTIEADAQPDVLGRVANLLNLANLAPQLVHLQRKSDEILTISVEIGPITNTSAELIRRKMTQLTCVTEVSLASRDN